MILKLDENWLGPIRCTTPFILQPVFAPVQLWWRIDGTRNGTLTVYREGFATEYDLGDEAHREGETIRPGETRRFPMIPDQELFLRAEESKASVIIEQWWQ